jgi:hypothetical protein
LIPAQVLVVAIIMILLKVLVEPVILLALLAAARQQVIVCHANPGLLSIHHYTRVKLPSAMRAVKHAQELYQLIA